jgi:hypothetical protein
MKVDFDKVHKDEIIDLVPDNSLKDWVPPSFDKVKIDLDGGRPNWLRFPKSVIRWEGTFKDIVESSKTDEYKKDLLKRWGLE